MSPNPTNPTVTYTHHCERCGQMKATNSQARPRGWARIEYEERSLVGVEAWSTGHRVLCETCWDEVRAVLLSVEPTPSQSLPGARLVEVLAQSPSPASDPGPDDSVCYDELS